MDAAIEPNETTGRAISVVYGEDRTGHEICPALSDFDLFKTELKAGERITVDYTFDSATLNLNARAFEPSRFVWADQPDQPGANASYVSTPTDTGARLVVDALECGDHYIQVGASSGLGRFDYSASRSRSSCQDGDEFAASCNHTYESAESALFSLVVDPLQLCPGGSDWYEVRGNTFALSRYHLTVRQGGDLDDVELRLFTSTRRPVGEVTRTTRKGKPGPYPQAELHRHQLLQDAGRIDRE